LIPKKSLFSADIKIAFIGGGKMAGAIISGLLKSLAVVPSQIFVFDIDKKRLAFLKKTYGIKTARSNQEILSLSRIVILALKPQKFAEALNGLDFSKVGLVISIAAGVTLEYLQDKIPGKPVIRVMPNNPALVQAGITAIVSSAESKKEDIEIAKSIFRTVGEVVETKEYLMDAITALSGSGPGFVYQFVEAMIEGAESLGLVKSVAEKLAVQTLLGSAQTLVKTKISARELKEMVTSPNGTTKAGLDVFEKKGFKQIVIDAIFAAAKRAKELGGSS